MTPLQFELAVLAKPYFQPEQLMIATVDDQLQGFTHCSLPLVINSKPVETEAVSAEEEQRSTTSILSALCVMPGENEAILADILLAETERAQLALGSTECITKPLPPASPFYLGFGFGDSMMGITTNDQRAYEWLTSAGYRPREATSGWELELSQFQAPVDRLQIQIRRTAHVDRLLEEPQMPWWHACVLGHTEPTGFQLTMRSEGRVAQYLLVWSVSPELSTAPESVVWMWPIEVTANQQSTDQLVFLIAEALRQMVDERVDVVRTVSGAAQTLVTNTLTRLGFRNTLSGMILEKRFSAE
jgi:hypothetical protein